MSLSRISITIPEELVTEADRKAVELDRSRSWVLVDALREYLAPREPGMKAGSARLVQEPEMEYLAGLGPSRTAQLEADLRLTPEERVLAAERTLLVDAARGHTPVQDRLVTFDRYEDYIEWQRREAVRL